MYEEMTKTDLSVEDSNVSICYHGMKKNQTHQLQWFMMIAVFALRILRESTIHLIAKKDSFFLTIQQLSLILSIYRFL